MILQMSITSMSVSPQIGEQRVGQLFSPPLHARNLKPGSPWGDPCDPLQAPMDTPGIIFGLKELDASPLPCWLETHFFKVI